MLACFCTKVPDDDDDALRAFFAALPPVHRTQLEADVDASMRAQIGLCLAEAARAWPAVAVTLTPDDRAAFAAYAAERLDAAKTLVQAATDQRTDELLVAWACLMRKPSAVAGFERTYMGEVDAAWRVITPPGMAMDEAQQRFREKLFVAAAGAAPAIAQYRGHGSLKAWTRVAATRMLLDLARSSRRDRTLGSEFLEDLALPGDPQNDLEKSSYRAAFKESLDAAAQALTTRERNLLRYVVLDGLTIDQIAAIYGVHRATAARRLADARASLGAQVRAILRRRLATNDADLDEMLALLESQVDLSLERVLGPVRT